MKLLGDDELERPAIVANRRMNRERDSSAAPAATPRRSASARSTSCGGGWPPIAESPGRSGISSYAWNLKAFVSRAMMGPESSASFSSDTGRWRIMGIDKATFISFCQCGYKAYLRTTGVVGDRDGYEAVLAEADDKFRRDAIEWFLRRSEGSRTSRQTPDLASAIEEGRRLILGARVEALGVDLTYDMIERQEVGRGEGRSILAPVVFSHKRRLGRVDSLVAALHGIVLAGATSHPVPFVKVVHGPAYSATKIKLDGPGGPTRLAKETRQALERLKLQVESASAPLLILNDHCSSCEYRVRCRAEAIQKDDLSLLRGMSAKEVQAQKRHGISTVGQFACTFRPKSVGARRNKPPKRHLHALQALAIRDQKVYVVRTPEIPAGATRVFLDVEGMPDRDFYYLVGVVVERGGESAVHSFWADDEAGEKSIWSDLAQLLGSLGDLTLFHYGSYEKTYLTKMRKKYPLLDSALGEGCTSASMNILEAVRTNVYFPAYSNGLKDVASFLGATWGGRIASGSDCIARRMRWEESKDDRIKEEIIGYNRDDCLAAQRVVLFLSSLGCPDVSPSPSIVPADQIGDGWHGRFGKIDFQIPGMDSINKCARFDYQQKKVFLRTDPEVRSSLRRKQAKRRSRFRANVEIVYEPATACPECGSSRVTTFRKRVPSKLLLDLDFTRSGVRRRIVRHVTSRQQCLACHTTFLPDSYPNGQRTGHGLSSWAVYQHVALKLSFEDVATTVYDLFGYPICEATSRRALTRLAETYRRTQEIMLEQLRGGSLIHADETKVGITGGSGYVWAFSGTEVVVYLFSPSREGTILQETIHDFAGVLVSDFYAAYDSPNCPQQKCHIHLMRDINEDLLQHPFDDELKEFARRYTSTLKPMVETIDKRGLLAKYLSKHKPDARSFLDWVTAQVAVSPIVHGYQKRIERYGERLFTFLDHDGVPWNNNCAENALKLVASRRRLLRNSMSEAGLKDYLVFLSIYQTLRRKGLSLLRFLLSGETDLEKYMASHPRR
jgi:predicted RecB family nuclease